MSRTSKRPSSARRNIKIETFSPFVSGTRLRNVQSLLRGPDESTDKPDTILCIAGIDSRYNGGSIELFNYLLFGFFETRKAELEKSGFEEEVIDDVVFVIRRYEVDIYCNPINYHYLLPYVSHWRNVRFHCVTEKQYEDEEESGNFKIESFIEMVADSKIVGVPFSIAGHKQKFDKMLVEKWPIVQAYALEDFGGRGFFTLSHDVMDISEDLHVLYRQIDPVSLENIITEQLPLLERQWTNMISTVTVDLAKDSKVVTEEKISEPLKSYYLHGLVGSHGFADKRLKEVPYVLFGTNTRKSVLDSLEDGGKTEKNKIHLTGTGNGPAKFMICRGTSPHSALSCIRTYFFTELSDPLQGPLNGDSAEDEETRILVEMYAAMVDSVTEAIQKYASHSQSHQARAKAVEILVDQCKKITNPNVQKYLQRRSNIVFTMEAAGTDGSGCPIEDGQRSLKLKTVKLFLYDIPSVTGKVAGSLAYSEVFLDSVIRVQKDDGTQYLNSEILILTANFPRFQAWHLSGSRPVQALQDKLTHGMGDTCGRMLIAGESVYAGTARNLGQFHLEVQLYAYEHALVLLHPQSGTVSLLNNRNLDSIHFYDGGTGSVLAVLFLVVKETAKSSLPTFLTSESNHIYLSLTPKTQAYKHMYSEILPAWKTESSLPAFIRCDTLPSEYNNTYNYLQNKYEMSPPTVQLTGFPRALATLPDLKLFLAHFSASSVSDVSIPEVAIPAIRNVVQPLDTDRSIAAENRKPGEEVESEDKTAEIVVNIIGGVQGIHMNTLCDTLMDITKDRIKWTVLRQPLDSPDSFIPGQLQMSLTSLVSNNRKRRSVVMSTTSKARVLVVTPTNVDVLQVVQAIHCHPDPEVRKVTKIGSVTVCVDPLNAYMERRLTLPNFLNDCAQGWVNNILFTSSTSVKNQSLLTIQNLLRSINTDVAFFLAEHGKVTRSMDIDAMLSETAFMQDEKVRARHLLCPGWSLGAWKEQMALLKMNSVVLRFSQPLESQLLMKKLKGLKSSLKSFPCKGNIYFVEGMLHLTDSPKMKELHHSTLSDTTTVTLAKNLDQLSNNVTNGDGPHNTKGDNFLVFTGCELQESVLKDLVRLCVKQKPEKKKLITRKNVTKEDEKKIHTQHHLEALPEGWFYNGTQFVSFDGQKQNTHPDLDKFIQQYVDQTNQEVEIYNKKVDEISRNYVDLFS
ncbi:dynein axonemal assembly factor 9-like [Argopecten irradians]|uniref:dynein axonemal assembly factor 9-like n=1 Tax=Argopecten irradians TaxID=31199 RepID=UPI0037191C6B